MKKEKSKKTLRAEDCEILGNYFKRELAKDAIQTILVCSKFLNYSELKQVIEILAQDLYERLIATLKTKM